MEFYGNDICQSDPEACTWLRDRFRQNTEFINQKVKELANTEPYWHQVNLFYQQMDGVNIGKKLEAFCKHLQYPFSHIYSRINAKLAQNISKI